MGVMPCYRKGCEEIMCRTYIDDVGYICSSCQSEFEEMIEQHKIRNDFYDSGNFTEGELTRKLSKFMKTTKGSHFEGEKMNVRDFFNNSTTDF